MSLLGIPAPCLQRVDLRVSLKLNEKCELPFHLHFSYDGFTSLHVCYVVLHLTCLVPCVFSGCLCLELYVILCSSFLTCFRCFKSNKFSCISCLIASMPCASCAFSALAICVFNSLGYG